MRFWLTKQFKERIGGRIGKDRSGLIGIELCEHRTNERGDGSIISLTDGTDHFTFNFAQRSEVFTTYRMDKASSRFFVLNRRRSPEKSFQPQEWRFEIRKTEPRREISRSKDDQH